MNGGSSTYRELLYHRTHQERNRNPALPFRPAGPLGPDSGRAEIPLGAWVPGSRTCDTRIWGRVESDSRSPYPNTICIVGHTPTVFLTDRHNEDFSIWHGDGILDIDCGCGSMKAVHRRLACLRLDDMAEFYVGGAEK